MKKAIYVEGLSEMVFVYQMIKTHFYEDWNQFHISCFNLRNASTTPHPEDYGCENAENQFLVRNVGNDESVVSSLIDDFNGLHDKGYVQVLGLRDVYGEKYKDQYGSSMNIADINDFMTSMQATIQSCVGSKDLSLHFAIMEVETWLLAIADNHVFQDIDSRLTDDWIKDKANVNMDEDMQNILYHPYVALKKILESVGKSYDKHWDDIKNIVYKLNKNDFESLRDSGKCSSYKAFYDSVFA
jgi:hypothetical protein